MALSNDEKGMYLLLCGWEQYGKFLWRVVEHTPKRTYRSRPLFIDEAYKWQKKYYEGETK
jgi:hypothetical protein